jgi:hypothetical protein
MKPFMLFSQMGMKFVADLSHINLSLLQPWSYNEVDCSLANKTMAKQALCLCTGQRFIYTH